MADLKYSKIVFPTVSVSRRAESFLNEKIAQERKRFNALFVICAMGYEMDMAERIYSASIRWGENPVEIATLAMQGRLKFEKFIEEQSRPGNLIPWQKRTPPQP